MPNPAYNTMTEANFIVGGQVVQVDPMDPEQMTAKDREALYNVTDPVARKIAELAEIISGNQGFIEEWLQGLDAVETHRVNPKSGSEVTVKVERPHETLQEIADFVNKIKGRFHVKAKYNHRGGGGKRAPKTSAAKERLQALKASTAERK